MARRVAPYDVPVPTTTEESPPVPLAPPSPPSPPLPPPLSPLPTQGSNMDDLGRRRRTRSSNKGKRSVSFAEEVQTGAWRSTGSANHTSVEFIDITFLS